jgi:hypothetical protein
MSLLGLQRDFQAWLEDEPVTVQARFGERARAGLAVYLNNYRAQLLACLGVSFPAVRTCMGIAAFEAAAAIHIAEVPPHAWTLDDYPAGFPATLERLYPDEPHWADLARLELALGVAFVAHDAAPLDTTTLRDVDWDSAVIQFVPSFTLLPVTTNAGDILSAIAAQRAAPPVVPAAEVSWLVVWRSEYTPMFRTASNSEVEVLALLRRRRPFGQICVALVDRLGEGAGTAAAGEMLARWLADGCIAEISGSPSGRKSPEAESRTRGRQLE